MMTNGIPTVAWPPNRTAARHGQRVPDGDEESQHRDEAGAPAHRPQLRGDLEPRDQHVLADEVAEVDHGVAGQPRRRAWTWWSSVAGS